MRLGIVKLKMEFSFASALAFHYICYMQANENQIHLLADVIPPAPASPFYTYLADGFGTDKLRPGCAVKVQLGQRMVSGIVLRVYRGSLNPDIEYREIREVLYDAPVLGEKNLALWQWVSEYYLCPLGSVMVTALPSELLSGIYRDKTENLLRLAPEAANDAQALRASLKNPKQLKCFEYFVSQYPAAVRSVDLPMEISRHSLKRLTDNGIIRKVEETVHRSNGVQANEGLKTLTGAQQKAYAEIQTAFSEAKTVLLHGVPASGKTEIYKQLIAETIDKGGQVLYLVPEIMLTTQLTGRLGRVFGDKLTVVHSMIPTSRKAEAFRRAKAGEPMVLIGARSAVFAPFDNLQLVIVDEEHDASYKQEDRQPLYNSKSVALMAAKMCGAHVLLGSATPSAESYYNCMIGKYAKVRLDEAYHKTQRPSIRIIDMVAEKRKRKVRKDFSFDLSDAIENTVNAGRQVILFHGRRGFNTFTVCDNCGWVPKCPNCGVSLVYHDKHEKLKCHYCGYTQNLPAECPDCGGVLRRAGSGTEKIEKDLRALMPDLRILRLDTDTCKTIGSYRSILDTFDSGAADVLVGTQMLVKGLDFANVGLVGIVNADLLLNFPDFRAVERAYQTLVQVAGRGGRKGSAAEVIVQTSKPDHPVFELLLNDGNDKIFDFVLSERKLFRYPPFYRVVNIELRHKDLSALRDMLRDAAIMLSGVFASDVSGPFTPYPSRKNMFYLSRIVLKTACGLPYRKVGAVLENLAAMLYAKYGNSRAQVVFDVDPV